MPYLATLPKLPSLFGHVPIHFHDPPYVYIIGDIGSIGGLLVEIAAFLSPGISYILLTIVVLDHLYL